MNNEPLISIIMPIYNVERYLRRSLDCVVNQTYKNIEIILVDDGSPDNCPAICDEYAANDSRIKVIHKENGGIGDARNAGLNVASGEYVTIFDPDDYFSLEVCKRIAEVAVCNNADMVVFNYKRIDEDGNIIEKIKRLSPLSLPDKVTEWSRNEFFKMVVSVDSEICGYTWNKLIKIEMLKDIRYNENRIASEDLLYMQELAVRLNKILYIPDELYFYILHEGSASNKKNDSDITELVIRDKIMQTARKFFPEQINECSYSLADVSFRVIKCVCNDRNAVKECSRIMRKYVKDISKCPDIPTKQKILYNICAIWPQLYFVAIGG